MVTCFVKEKVEKSQEKQSLQIIVICVKLFQFILDGKMQKGDEVI